MLKIAREGYLFVIVFFLVTVFTYIVSEPLVAFLPSALTLFMIFFFRDPERKIPDKEGLFTSPADGKIIVIKNVFENEYLKSDVKQISIFMSPFNVHVNRAPCDGMVKIVKHTPGGFSAAYKDEASLSNENIAMVLDGQYGSILVIQIAGFVARRAVCRVKPGDELKRGERYGIIKFSSRLDVYIPKNTEIKVKLGDKVKAGETIIGTIK